MSDDDMIPNLSDPTLERSFKGHKDVITGLSFKPSMTQLASSSNDHSVMVWNFKPQLRAFRFIGHKGAVTSVDFSRSGSLLASSSRDKTVRLWTPTVKGDVTVFRAHTSSVRSVEFSCDSERLVTASDDKSVKIWQTQRSKFLFTLAGHLNWVRTAKFSPDSRMVVSGSDDKSVKLWDLCSKSCIKTYWDHVSMVSSVAFHPTGTIIASASIDKSIKLFDIRTHKLVQHYGDAHSAESGGVNSISFGGPRGEWMISTGNDGLIWDLKEGHLLYTLYGHKYGASTSAVFSPNGDFFATGGVDSQVMVWKSNLESLSKIEAAIPFQKEADISPPMAEERPQSRNNIYSDPSVSAPHVHTQKAISIVQIKNASGGINSRPMSNVVSPLRDQLADLPASVDTLPALGAHTQLANSAVRIKYASSGTTLRPANVVSPLKDRQADSTTSTQQPIFKSVTSNASSSPENHITKNADKDESGRDEAHLPRPSIIPPETTKASNNSSKEV